MSARVPRLAALAAVALTFAAASVAAAPTIQVIGSAALGPNSVLEMEVGGPNPGSQHDQIIVTGTLILNGTLRIVLINSFSPGEGDEFVLIDPAAGGGTVQGQFSDYDYPGIGRGLEWRFTPGVLSVICIDDFDESGTKTIADIFFFLARWFASDPRCDVDQSGTLTISDIFTYLAIWFGGC